MHGSMETYNTEAEQYFLQFEPEHSGLQVGGIDSGESDIQDTVREPYTHERWLNDDENLKEMSGEENFEYWMKVGGGRKPWKNHDWVNYMTAQENFDFWIAHSGGEQMSLNRGFKTPMETFNDGQTNLFEGEQ